MVSPRIALFLLLALWASSVGAEEPNELSEPSQPTPSEIAKQLHNPLSNLREVIFQLDALPNVGPDEKTNWATTIQPVWPFPLVADWKLVTYSIIPVVSQPGLAPGADRTNGLGDSTFFGYLVPPNEGQIIWGFGPGLQAPTHTDDDLGSDNWAAGPALIVGWQPGDWSIFGLLDNIWSFAGSDSDDINLLNFQYQVVRLVSQGLVLHHQLDRRGRLGGTQRGPLDGTDRRRVRETVQALWKSVSGLRASRLQRGSAR